MLKFLRKKMKIVLISVAVVFGLSIFYGLNFGSKNMDSQKSKGAAGFLKVNGKEVDPMHYNRIYNNIRANLPQRLSPREALFVTSLTVSQAVDFTLMLQAAEKEVRVSGSELNQAIDQLVKEEKLSSVDQLKRTLKQGGVEWKNFKRFVKEDMLVKKMIAKKQEEVKLSKDDLREIKARHILIRSVKEKESETKKRIEQIYGRVKKGEDFELLARKYSEDPGSKDKGGDLGYIATGMMVPQFEAAAFKLKNGEISNPVETEFGWHIIKVEDSRLRRVGTVEGAGENMERTILQEKQQKAGSEWMYSLKKNAKIEILDPQLRALDFQMKGKYAEAAAEYQKAIAQTPGSPYLHVFLGGLYEEMKNDKGALSEYQKAVDLSTGDSFLYVTLGDQLVKMGQREEAIGVYKKASLIAGDNQSAHEEILEKFKAIDARRQIREEIEIIAQIGKKEAFEKELKQKTQKVITK